MKKKFFGLVLLATLGTSLYAAPVAITVPVFATDSSNPQQIGSIKFSASHGGVLITPDLHHLSPGIHGMHIHENPSCADNGIAAGGHLDPVRNAAHHGPYEHDGHLGDLPFLYVDQQGDAVMPILAPNIKMQQLHGHSIMIHAGGDNYADTPEKLGGGGARIACGVVK